MARKCLLPAQAEKLKEAFRNGEITFQELYKLGSSEARVKKLSEFVGEQAEETNAKLEKAFLSPNQKLALRNFVFTEIAQAKPLYVGLTLDESEKMAKGLKMSALEKMSDEERIAELSKFVDPALAENLNKRFNALKKSGNLPNWEERVMGTKELRENKEIKGSMARLEALNQMGVLSETQLEKFMGSFVKDKLKVNITMEQSNELSKLVDRQTELFDELVESGDLTYRNEKLITEYLLKQREIREFELNLQPQSFAKTANKVIAYMRSTLLFRLNSLKNSFLYQIVPSAERYILKRAISVNIGDKESSLLEKMQAKFIKVKMPEELKNFIANQTKMGVRIYHKTGFDLSRMDTFDGGYNIFAGERFDPIYGTKKLSEAKTRKEQVAIALNNYARFINLGPKWAAGGTDTIIANFARADSAVVYAKQFVQMEKKQGKLPKGMTEQERITELVKDSYELSPVDEKAKLIKESAIMDAHMSNNTQKDGMADWVTKLRDNFNIGNVSIGKAIVPFMKIQATTISRGLRAATGYDVIKGIYQINQASKETNEVERHKKIYQATAAIVGGVGIMGAAILLSLFLDDDDYIGEYDLISGKEYGLAKARGAGAGYVRIGGKWIPVKYLPMINIPLGAIMLARQSKGRGDSVDEVAFNYVRGVVGGFLSTPGISNVKDLLDAGAGAVQNKDLVKALDKAGFSGDDIGNYAWTRAVPAVISYEFWNTAFPPDAKYDYLGRPIEKNIWKFWGDDKSNEITSEFSRLNDAGQAPVISDPTGKSANEAMERLGAEKYNEKLQDLKQKYADRVLKRIRSASYKRMTDADKKEAINEIRQDMILDRL